jgi:dihydroxy-acid dehydratase
LLRTGDRVRIDLRKGAANVLISAEELEVRRAALSAAGGFQYPVSQTPWQELQRRVVGPLGTGAIIEGAEKYQKIDQTYGIPRDNH